MKVLKKGETDLCYQYHYDYGYGLFLTNFVTILVTVINIVIRTINIKLINSIGYATVSKQVSLIMLSIFWATFINTGVILLMTNAELAYAPGPLSWFPLHAQYPDLDENWYEDIGPQLCKTMFIMAIYPYIEMLIFGGIWNLKRVLDGGCCGDKHQTKTKTLTQFINIYAGPLYLMHFKYSSIMTQVYISFMYGLFIPVLFPIAAFGIMNMYLVERFALIYYYRKPPMYDEKLQKDSIAVLKNAPIAMYLMGYWAVGNTQIFFGEKQEKIHNNKVSDPKHHLIDHGHNLNQTHMLLILIFIFFVKKFIVDTIGNCIKNIAKYCCQVQWEHDIQGEDVEEQIGSYWDSLTGDDQKIWYASEIYSKYRFGITSVNDDALELLRTKDRRKAPKIKGKVAKFIEGDSTYDILKNVTYQQDFQYNSIEQRNELEDFLLSDMILRALNLDEDHKSKNEDDDTDIFTGSFGLLVSQAKESANKASLTDRLSMMESAG